MTQTRVTQVVIESVESPTPVSRFSQDAIEAVVSPTPRSRVTQTAIEAIVTANPTSRVSQIVIEVLVPNAPPQTLVASGQLWPRGGDTPAAMSTVVAPSIEPALFFSGRLI